MIADECDFRAWMATGLTGDAAAYRRLLVALSPQSDAKNVAGLPGGLAGRFLLRW